MTPILKQFYWKDYLNITLGLVLYAIGLIGFIKPGEVVTGGLTGITLLIEYGTDGRIPLQYSYFLINVALLAAALKILGLKFLLKTIYSVIMLTLLITVARQFITEPLIPDEPIMSAIIGGSIGALLGMQVFRHKTKHASFRIGMPCILIVQIALAVSYYIFR